MIKPRRGIEYRGATPCSGSLCDLGSGVNFIKALGLEEAKLVLEEGGDDGSEI